MNAALKNNLLYHLYFRQRYVVDRERSEEKSSLPFFRSLFPNKVPLIFDIGANHGDYAWVFEQVADKVVCLEPDASNFEFLNLRFARTPQVSIVNSAVGETVGTHDFFVVNDGSGLNTLSEKRTNDINVRKKVTVQVTTVAKLIEQFGKPDYIKIDVEGYEVNVLKGLKQKIKLVSFEANLPAFLEESYQCIDMLAALGGNCSFNYEYENKLVLDKWVSAAEMKNILKNTTTPYANVFCKSE